MKRTLLFLVAAGLLLFGGFTLLRERPPAPGADRAAAYPVTVVDDEGVTATVTSLPRRLAVFAPHFTETIFKLGAGERIVAATAAETFPRAATAIPSAVEADGITPSAVRIGQLAPDVVITSGFKGAPWKAQVRAAGIPVITLNATSIDDAVGDIDKVGEIVGRAPQAATLTRTMRRQLAQIAGRIGDRPPPKVLLLTFARPITAATGSGYAGALIREAGGTPAVPPGGDAAADRDVRQSSVEEISAASPDFVGATTSAVPTKAALTALPGLSQVDAVRSGRVFVLPDELILRPGPRLVQGIRELARILHPDAF